MRSPGGRENVSSPFSDIFGINSRHRRKGFGCRALCFDAMISEKRHAWVHREACHMKFMPRKGFGHIGLWNESCSLCLVAAYLVFDTAKLCKWLAREHAEDCSQVKRLEDKNLGEVVEPWDAQDMTRLCAVSVE